MNYKNYPNEITIPFDSPFCYSDDDYRRQTYRERKRKNLSYILKQREYRLVKKGKRDDSRPCTSSDSVICRHDDVGKASRRLFFWIIYGQRLHEDDVTTRGETPVDLDRDQRHRKSLFPILRLPLTGKQESSFSSVKRKPFSISLATNSLCLSRMYHILLH